MLQYGRLRLLHSVSTNLPSKMVTRRAMKEANSRL
jgi:hypothetical protein